MMTKLNWIGSSKCH